MRAGSHPPTTRAPAHLVVALTAALIALGSVLWVAFGPAGPSDADAAVALVAATTVVTPAPTTGPASTSPPSTAAPDSSVTTPVTPPDSGAVTVPVTDPPPVTDQSGNQGGSYQAEGDASGYQGDQSTGTPDVAGDTPMTTTENLLVGPPPSTATTTTVVRQDLSTTAVTHKGGSSDPKVWLDVVGLVLVALLLGVSTFMYWRRTTPSSSGLDDDREGRTGKRARGSRYSDLVITVPKSS
ncbi:MAG TPA: hypothetical protein VFN21_07010 [Acidimicrobiales bacterium]|nr:hypothetical protein [Acidimicrobiales bacterium]